MSRSSSDNSETVSLGNCRHLLQFRWISSHLLQSEFEMSSSRVLKKGLAISG